MTQSSVEIIRIAAIPEAFGSLLHSSALHLRPSSSLLRSFWTSSIGSSSLRLFLVALFFFLVRLSVPIRLLVQFTRSARSLFDLLAKEEHVLVWEAWMRSIGFFTSSRTHSGRDKLKCAHQVLAEKLMFLSWNIKFIEVNAVEYKRRDPGFMKLLLSLLRITLAAESQRPSGADLLAYEMLHKVSLFDFDPSSNRMPKVRERVNETFNLTRHRSNNIYCRRRWLFLWNPSQTPPQLSH
ncbi:hypothetical protein MUK42_16189 [Musa troglodytarum]|uniref:Uncharacterized protein n=1 Tax=Musa troglodytarum TaxID=320322 RepID=A0A9E7L7M2_9LILI|nr:hypothetical protein MUK42_16189 [Musa troglodytarum]